jgi:hypothetical protein
VRFFRFECGKSPYIRWSGPVIIVAAPCAHVCVRGPVQKAVRARPLNSVVRQHMTVRTAIIGCWLFVALFVAAVFTWIWADNPEVWPFSMVAVAPALIALVSASTSRLAGALLACASLALGAAALVALLPVPHGGSNIRPAAVVILNIAFFVILPIAIFSFIVGLSRLFASAASDTSAGESLSEEAGKHE